MDFLIDASIDQSRPARQAYAPALTAAKEDAGIAEPDEGLAQRLDTEPRRCNSKMSSNERS
jgi:hypothetical protein